MLERSKYDMMQLIEDYILLLEILYDIRLNYRIRARSNPPGVFLVYMASKIGGGYRRSPLSSDYLNQKFDWLCQCYADISSDIAYDFELNGVVIGMVYKGDLFVMRRGVCMPVSRFRNYSEKGQYVN